MAILRVEPSDVPFRIGWKTKSYPDPEFYSEAAQTQDGLLAMAIGADDVTFVVRPVNSSTQLSITLVEVVPENHLDYTATPRY